MNKAFSLFELSIVLVILGLLTGGVLAGQSLIRAAELRSVVSDLNRYNITMYAFRDKYFSLPGDIANATSFWGTAACNPTASTPFTGQATCNGNGNGLITWDLNTFGTINEAFPFWQHLANAGLIEGQYTGITDNASYGNHAVIGQNVPRLKLGNTGISMRYESSTSVAALLTSVASAHVFYLGTQQSTYYTIGQFLKAEEAWNIDTKLDDGKPGAGKMVQFTNALRGNCVSSDIPSSADYLLSNSNVGCVINWITGF